MIGVFFISILVQSTFNGLEDSKVNPEQKTEILNAEGTSSNEEKQSSPEEKTIASESPLTFTQEEKYTQPPNPTEEVISQLPYGFTFSYSTVTGLCLIALILILFVFWKCCLKSATHAGDIRDDIQAALNDDIDEDIQITLDVDDIDDANDENELHDV